MDRGDNDIARLLDRPHPRGDLCDRAGRQLGQQREAGAGIGGGPVARGAAVERGEREDQHARPRADGQDGRPRSLSRSAPRTGGVDAGGAQRVEGLAESCATQSSTWLLASTQQLIPAASPDARS